jgi:hypothetical protein
MYYEVCILISVICERLLAKGWLVKSSLGPLVDGPELSHHLH